MTHRDNLLLELRPLLDSLNPKGKTILEIGQGMDEQIRKELEEKGLIYTASDNYIGINNAGNRLLGKEYHYNKMEELSDFADNTFDFVLVCHAFEHCERPIDALKEMKRVLKKDGMLILITPNPCKHHIIDADNDHIMVLSEMQMLRILIYAGFTGVNSYTQKNWSWKEQDWNVFSIGVK